MKFLNYLKKEILDVIVELKIQVFYINIYINKNVFFLVCECLLDCNNEEKKNIHNEKNRYNHNFEGLYCWCNSKYDPETMIMYQCIICLDW